MVDAGCDWFTVTVKEGIKADFVEVGVDKIMTNYANEGRVRTTSNRLGYVGDRVDQLFYGRRGDELMVIASGEVAQRHNAYFLGMADKVTRLDLQVTLQDHDIDRDWTKIALRQCSMDGRVDSGLLKTRRIAGTPNGATLYVGSRSSSRFIRIYDKSAESKEEWPERSWRWEIEYKHPRASLVAARLLRSGASSSAVLDVLGSGLADLRIILPVGQMPDGWKPKPPKKMTTDESRLLYTQRVVGPFIQGLIRAVGEDRVKEALDGAGLGKLDHLVRRRGRYTP
jgi:Replication initiation factor